MRALWNASFPEEELRDLISEQWKEMGWQGKDPSTDFRYAGFSLLFYCLSLQDFCSNLYMDLSGRGGGFISLENLLFFARNYPVCPDPCLFHFIKNKSNKSNAFVLSYWTI